MIDQGSEFKKPGVVGAGAWGTALAELIARHEKPVKLWAFEDEVIQSISQAHENKPLQNHLLGAKNRNLCLSI